MKIHGDIWKHNWSVPPIVFQEEMKGKQVNPKQETAKAAVLKDDSLSQDLNIAFCYNQKPFNMILHRIEG